MGGGWREDCSFVPLFELLNRFTRTEAHDFDFDFTRIIQWEKFVLVCIKFVLV